MYIKYDLYRVFYFAAKYGNLSKAAAILLTNQPNVTRAVKSLERELGCPLFVRTNRGMKLTPEGEKLYAHVRIAFEHIEAGETELLESRGLQNGTVFVASSEVALRCMLMPVLKRFRTLYPGIRVRISNHSTPQAIEALKEGIADIAAVTTPTGQSASLSETTVRTFREVPVCAVGCRELTQGPVTLEQLQKYPIISLGTETMTFSFYTSLFEKRGLPYEPEIEAATADQILPMVEAGLGVGFVPEEFIHPWDKVRVIELDHQVPERGICVIKRKDQPLSMAARELEKMILSRSEELE